MGVKGKCFLKEEAFLQISVSLLNLQENCRESSISRALKCAKKSRIEEAISSHEACSSRVLKEDIQELELTLEKC